MKIITTTASIALIALSLTACGSDEKTTVIHDRPVVVAPAASGPAAGSSIEDSCKHGYDNSSHSCY